MTKLFIFISLMLASYSALACKCVPLNKNVEEKYANAHAIFLGVATKSQEIKPFDMSPEGPIGMPPMTKIATTFSVAVEFKGTGAKELEVLTRKYSASCGRRFKVGKLFLAFVYKKPGSDVLTTSLCSTAALTSSEKLAYEVMSILTELE